MPGGAEHHLLARVVGVRAPVVVRRDELVDVDEVLGQGGATGSLVHVSDPATQASPRRPLAPGLPWRNGGHRRSEEHTSELQSRGHLVCRLLLEKEQVVRKWRVTR